MSCLAWDVKEKFHDSGEFDDAQREDGRHLEGEAHPVTTRISFQM